MRALPARLLALSALLPGAVDAAEPAKQPYEIVRELQVFQDQAVLKTKSARTEQKERIAAVAAQLIEFDNKVWADPRNARAAVVYVLTGGDPRVLRKLTGVGGETGIDERLVKGALAYGERRDDEAKRLLEEIDVDALDRSIGSHVALVRALLVAPSEPRKAVPLLDKARLDSPGTMIEEAALRREAILAANIDDLDAFETLSSQYFRRFGTSIFMSSFVRQFAEAAVAKGYGTDPKRTEKLEAMIKALADAERRDTCLALAEVGIVAGKVDIVRLASRLSGISRNQPLEAMRMVLFEGAAKIASTDFEQGRTLLRLVDRSKLSAREEGLLHAALSVADQIARPPSFGAVPAKAPGETSEAEDEGVVSEARRAIARADGLLSGAPQ